MLSIKFGGLIVLLLLVLLAMLSGLGLGFGIGKSGSGNGGNSSMNGNNESVPAVSENRIIEATVPTSNMTEEATMKQEHSQKESLTQVITIEKRGTIYFADNEKIGNYRDLEKLIDDKPLGVDYDLSGLVGTGESYDRVVRMLKEKGRTIK